MIDFERYKTEKPEVYAYKCPKCKTLYYPVPMICRHCGARRDPSGTFFSSWDKVPLNGKCKLLTWTRLYNLPTGFSQRYLLFGIVEFESGLRASGRLLVERPKIGMELITKVGLVREKVNQDIYGLMFDAPVSKK